MAARGALTIPPAEIPEACKENVDKLHQSVRTLFTHKCIPWEVVAKMADDGYVTMEDLTDRWDTAENARTASPAELSQGPRKKLLLYASLPMCPTCQGGG